MQYVLPAYEYIRFAIAARESRFELSLGREDKAEERGKTEGKLMFSVNLSSCSNSKSTRILCIQSYILLNRY